MEDFITEILTKKSFKIIVKAHARQNALVNYDIIKDTYRVEIKAEAKDNKANIELMKFLSKLLKRRVEIVTGFTSKEKILRFV
jgi:uncharacterized protein